MARARQGLPAASAADNRIGASSTRGTRPPSLVLGRAAATPAGHVVGFTSLPPAAWPIIAAAVAGGTALAAAGRRPQASARGSERNGNTGYPPRDRHLAVASCGRDRAAG